MLKYKHQYLLQEKGVKRACRIHTGSRKWVKFETSPFSPYNYTPDIEKPAENKFEAKKGKASKAFSKIIFLFDYFPILVHCHFIILPILTLFHFSFLPSHGFSLLLEILLLFSSFPFLYSISPSSTRVFALICGSFIPFFLFFLQFCSTVDFSLLF